jgi:hypothetical protein
VAYLEGHEETLDGGERSGSCANIMDFPNDAHRALLADFLDAIEAGRDPRVTGEEALASQELVQDVLARARGVSAG